jgi:hypothetical protein
MFFRCLGPFIFSGKPIRDYFPMGSSDTPFIMDDVTSAALRLALAYPFMRRLFETMDGYIEQGPFTTEVGDHICVLFSSSTPVLLRPGDGGYRIIGDAYVRGIMEGGALEMLKHNTLKTETFRTI